MNQDISTVQNAILNELRRLESTTRDLLKTLRVKIESSKLQREELEYEEDKDLNKSVAEDLEPIKATEKNDRKFKFRDLITPLAFSGLAAFPDIRSIFGFGAKPTGTPDIDTAGMGGSVSPTQAAASKMSTKDFQQIPQAVKYASDDREIPTTIKGIGSQRAMKEVEMTGNNKDIAMNFFIDRGFSPEQSAGIVGNLIAESNLNPTAYNKAGGGRGARGIAQWRGSRIDDFIRIIGKDPLEASFIEQLQFIAWELNNTEKSTKDSLLKAKTVAEAARIWEKKYERAGGSALQKRIDYAEAISTDYNKMNIEPTNLSMQDLSPNKRKRMIGTTYIDASQTNYISSNGRNKTVNYVPTRDSVYFNYKSVV